MVERLNDEELAAREYELQQVRQEMDDGFEAGQSSADFLGQFWRYVRLAAEIEGELANRAIGRSYRVGFTHGFVATAVVTIVVTVLVAVLS